jgi:hypothetical protein
MKLAIRKTPAEYFQKTEHAVKHAYSGLDSCWSYYRQALQHTMPIIVGLFYPPKQAMGDLFD